jgi:hypothetical protein
LQVGGAAQALAATTRPTQLRLAIDAAAAFTLQKFGVAQHGVVLVADVERP